jgi:DNA-binding transcriptional LysR family regulator
MQDLNDLYLFVRVVEQNGFAAAARVLGMPRSRLSRRMGLLEERLGVRLIQRSTRRFSITEIGREYYRHCAAMLIEAEAAEEAIHRVRAAPRGVVRVSCPPSMLYARVGGMIAGFMSANPEVEVQLESTNRRVDLIREGFDIAIRMRFPPVEESDLMMKVLADSPQRLVAAPLLIKNLSGPLIPAHLSSLPSLGWGPLHREHEWRLSGPDGATACVPHQPRFITEDMASLRLAAIRGIGVVQLPLIVVDKDLLDGSLVEVLPEWSSPAGIIHALFPSRRGLLPSVRALLDFLAMEFAAPKERTGA